MDMIVILLGLALLLVLTLKKVPVVFASLFSVVFIAIFSGLPVVETVTQDYMIGFAGFVQSAWLMHYLLFDVVQGRLVRGAGKGFKWHHKGRMLGLCGNKRHAAKDAGVHCVIHWLQT